MSSSRIKEVACTSVCSHKWACNFVVTLCLSCLKGIRVLDVQAIRSDDSGKGKILQLFKLLSGAAACCNSASAVVFTFEKDALSSHLLDLLAAKSRGLGLILPSEQQAAPYDVVLIIGLFAAARGPSTDSRQQVPLILGPVPSQAIDISCCNSNDCAAGPRAGPLD